jgi:hypothetical protein
LVIAFTGNASGLLIAVAQRPDRRQDYRLAAGCTNCIQEYLLELGSQVIGGFTDTGGDA